MKLIDKLLIAYTLLCYSLFVAIAFSTSTLMLVQMAYIALMYCVGVVIWRYWKQIQAIVQLGRNFPLSTFLILGFGMVLLEEFFVGTLYTFYEGFSIPLLFTRVGQFWLFNIFAFAGLILGWYLLSKWIDFSLREKILLACLYGLVSERVYRILFSGQFVQFFIWLPVFAAVYAVILTPALLSVTERGQRHVWRIFAYPLAFIVPLVCSMPFIFILTILRKSYPAWFPPLVYIPV